MPPRSQKPAPEPNGGIPQNTSENSWDVTLAGFIGGVIAVLMRQIREFFSAGHVVTKFDAEVWGFVIGFGLLGALLVRIFKEPNAGKAFVFGIALPSFLINLGAGVQNDPQKKSDSQVRPEPSAAEIHGSAFGMLSLLAPSAYAADPVAPWSVPDRTLEIVTVDDRFAYHAELLDAGGRTIKPIDVPLGASALYRTEVPAEAASIRFGSGEKVLVKDFTKRVPGIVIGIALRVKFERSVGVAELLGKNPETTRTYSAELEEREKAPVGLKGWVFLGNRDANGWGIQTIDSGNVLPKAGDVVSVAIPVNVRDAARSKQPRIGIITSGQRIRLLTDPQGPGAFWAQIEVVPDINR